MKKLDLKDKVILITGASGGIGKAVAEGFYKCGAKLVLTDLSLEALNTTFAEMDHSRVFIATLNVVNMAETKAVVAEAIKRFGRIDVAFANAGIGAKTPTTMLAITDDEFQQIVNVDLFGVWNTIKATLPHIIDAQGHILITASIYAFVNGMANAPYAASKAAVESLGRALRTELAGTGATAGVLYPGWVETPIAKVAFGGHQEATTLVKHAMPGPFGRAVQPSVIADAVIAGVESRASRIIAPKRWIPMSLLRGLLNATSDALLDRDRKVHQLIRSLEKRAIAKHLD
ncbi:SDR family NAD(P)-dependent oxidoreductase [Aquirhabdus parva]|uniref:SDR family NAD(P)-dependent oxidoreductase n=1 Tax=Aquirhabdus parva TaxID=2283318 RepID=A0A345P7L9_9GAMM|nr:SDR family NAD(P)-dependent oxidoreductase [Aquirhabdus parva]AXI03278.1 SDR family NAD(P)-dependent oxidoreductase [Aquirhabdus parva]